MAEKHPLVSVIIPLYNSFEFLNYSIRSVIEQSYANLEIIVIDDSPFDDGSYNLLKSYSDSRIKYIRNPNRLGLVESLNYGIKLSSGEFIARMDADDISHIERIERQVKYLNEHPEVDILSCNCYMIDVNNRVIGKTDHPENDRDIKIKMFFEDAIVHPATMIRRSFFNKNLYDKSCFCAEDYELWTRVIEYTIFHNLKACLLKYRVSKNSTYHRQYKRLQEDNEYYTKYRNIMYRIYCNVMSFYCGDDLDDLVDFYLDIILAHNEEISNYDKESFLIRSKKIISKKYPDSKFLNQYLGRRWIIWTRLAFWKTRSIVLLVYSLEYLFKFFINKYILRIYGGLFVNKKIFRW